MRAECQFAKAGQGLFYNGLLVDNKGQSFSFVYDCGTSDAANILNHGIADYKTLIDKRLDLLSISHFHYDHVSHISKLIEGLELGTVVIPFVKPEMRLLLAAQCKEIEHDDERIRFYSNPEMYFAAYGAETVVTVIYDENGADFFNNEENDNYLKENEINREDPNRVVMVGNLISQMASDFFNRTKEYRGQFRLIAPGYHWEFCFVNLHYDRVQDGFWDEIATLLGKHNNSFEEILKNKTYTKNLRKIYEDNFGGGLNETSLIMLSKPQNNGRVVTDSCNYEQWESIECSNSNIFNTPCQKRGHASTLLLGDLSLDSKLVDRYLFRLEKHLPWMPRVIQLPHHGARSKRHPFYHKICQGCPLPVSLVASYGIKNKYGHPDFSFYKSLYAEESFWKHIHMELVNERREFIYTIAY